MQPHCLIVEQDTQQVETHMGVQFQWWLSNTPPGSLPPYLVTSKCRFAWASPLWSLVYSFSVCVCVCVCVCVRICSSLPGPCRRHCSLQWEPPHLSCLCWQLHSHPSPPFYPVEMTEQLSGVGQQINLLSPLLSVPAALPISSVREKLTPPWAEICSERSYIY